MRFISNSSDDTKNFGYQIGKCLSPGNVVGLYGELGSGKTVLVKGIARAFGIDEKEIMSASFTIIAEYNTDPRFNHIDLYRIKEESEIGELGLWDCMRNDTVSVIEWAEKIDHELPDDAIKIKFRSLGENIREITVEGRDEKYWNNL